MASGSEYIPLSRARRPANAALTIVVYVAVSWHTGLAWRKSDRSESAAARTDASGSTPNTAAYARRRASCGPTGSAAASEPVGVSGAVCRSCVGASISICISDCNARSTSDGAGGSSASSNKSPSPSSSGSIARRLSRVSSNGCRVISAASWSGN